MLSVQQLSTHSGFVLAELIIQSTTPEEIMETAKNFLMEQTKQGSPKGRKTRPQEALAKVGKQPAVTYDTLNFCSLSSAPAEQDMRKRG